MKKGEYSKFRDDNKIQHESFSRDDDRPSQLPHKVIGEIKTITGGPFSGGLFKSLKKAYQRQVNSVHTIPPSKHRWTYQDMSFNEGDAMGVKQPHNDLLVIMLNIEGFNTKRILVDNGSSADIIYLPTFWQLKLDPPHFSLWFSPQFGEKMFSSKMVGLRRKLPHPIFSPKPNISLPLFSPLLTQPNRSLSMYFSKVTTIRRFQSWIYFFKKIIKKIRRGKKKKKKKKERQQIELQYFSISLVLFFFAYPTKKKSLILFLQYTTLFYLFIRCFLGSH